eukprot:CAMPEP_0172600712 /NCGR_PEP_ID=MMETSP1068-20121228/20866_1 /TAXON_ID=35684 /ORGANISM="Pseudopedinella elastica, Strain CCMP716" /LENGTH=99 /DNA_ID=CAMNT_0013401455 /DNA_START=161 /DNA_END=457 /DNA_ORIENTATION=+
MKSPWKSTTPPTAGGSEECLLLVPRLERKQLSRVEDALWVKHPLEVAHGLQDLGGVDGQVLQELALAAADPVLCADAAAAPVDPLVEPRLETPLHPAAQ